MTDRFKIDLRGVIELASNHMYTSPEVFVRATVQNALDAITARRRLDPDHVGSIRIELHPGVEGRRDSICVVDNGIGLTTDEVHEFLSTVGASSKREDAEDAVEDIANESFLGRFGIGLLSCFMVSDELVVVTRSARDMDAPPVEWRGRADGSYAVRELDSQDIDPGTSIYLTAKEDAEEYFQQDQLVELARQYAEMLPADIVVVAQGAEVPINRPTRPWEIDPEDTVALQDACQHALGFRPIDAFKLKAPAGGIVGYAFVRPDRAPAWAWGSYHRLYAHDMFVGDEIHGLVPRWATFVSCIVNAKGLRLTASREAVHHDDALARAGEQIGTAIRARLVHLLRHDRERFDVVMSAHDTEIRALAVKDAAFCDVIIDLLEFDTTLGPIRLGEFRREHHTLLLARTAEQFRRIATVAPAAGLRVFNAGYTYHEELLGRVAERHPELEVRAFDTADIVEGWPEPQDVSSFDRLLDIGRGVLEHREAELAVRAFEPSSLPAFYALGVEAEFHRQLDRTKSMASGLWNEILDAMAPRPELANPTRLCLNANSSLVRRLASIQDDDLLRTGVEVLFVQALMNGQHSLSVDELHLLNAGLERLLATCAGAES